MSAEPEHVWLLLTLEKFGPLAIEDLERIAREARGDAKSGPRIFPDKSKFKALLKPNQPPLKEAWIEKQVDGRFALTEKGLALLQAETAEGDPSEDEDRSNQTRLERIRYGIREVQRLSLIHI